MRCLSGSLPTGWIGQLIARRFELLELLLEVIETTTHRLDIASQLALVRIRVS